MRINIWGINYAPELTGIAVYNTGLCNYLSECGDEVTMVTGFPYYPSWRKSPQDAGKFWRTEMCGKVQVNRCWLYVPEQPTAIARIIHELTFVMTSFVRQLSLPAPDIYIVVSPPLLLGMAAWLLSLFKGVPYIFHVQDLQPDAALNTEILKPGPARGLLYALERLSYEKAVAVSAISTQMCDRIHSKGVPAEKLFYFPNWVDLDEFNRPARGAWRQQSGIDDAIQLVSYCGNLGVKQAAEKIVEAAQQLKDHPGIRFVIAGNGAQRNRIRTLIAELGLTNLQLIDVLPEEQHTALLVDSDLCLITQKPGSASNFLPSKLLKTLAVGRAIVTNAEEGSPLRDEVMKGGFGRVADPADKCGLANGIVELLGDDNTRVEMERAGKKYVSQFDKQKVLQRFRQFLVEKIKPRNHQ